jgi:hypothetical protein
MYTSPAPPNARIPHGQWQFLQTQKQINENRFSFTQPYWDIFLPSKVDVPLPSSSKMQSDRLVAYFNIMAVSANSTKKVL